MFDIIIENLLSSLSYLQETITPLQAVFLLNVAIFAYYLYIYFNRRNTGGDESPKSPKKEVESSLQTNDMPSQQYSASLEDDLSSLPPDLARYIILCRNYRQTQPQNNRTILDYPIDDEIAEIGKPTTDNRAPAKNPIYKFTEFERALRGVNYGTSSSHDILGLRRTVSEDFNTRRNLRRRYSFPLYPPIPEVDENEETEEDQRASINDIGGAGDSNL